MSAPLEPILIVDDDKLVLASLKATLEREGYLIFTALSGHEALEILNDQPIDIILCDQRMPDMQGIEVLKEAKELRPEAIRILLTANTDQETAVRAINIGQVSHFLSKPWDENVLIQTIRMCTERFLLEKEMKAMQELILESHKELAQTHKGLKQQLELGAKIHETLLLGHVPSDIPGVDVQAVSIPSDEIDGDFFEFYRPLSHLCDVVVGDVMGKGIPAALVGTAVKTQLVRFAVPAHHAIKFDRETFWHEDVLSTKQIVTRVHEAIATELIKLEYFVSLIYGRFDLKKRTLTYINAGFTHPLHYHAGTQKASFLPGSHFPLGFVSEQEFQAHEVSFEEGDIFLFCSDGVTETKSKEGEIYGIERLKDLFEKVAEKDERIDLIRKEVSQYQGEFQIADDLTLIAIKIKNFLPIQLGERGKTKFSADYSQLQAVREYVEKICHDAPGDSERLSQDLKLAINEIFCNIVKHGYKTNPSGLIIIQAEHDLKGIKVEISDCGITFDPLMLSEPSFYGDKEDGYGWYIVRQVMDEVMYLPKRQEKGWNHLRLYKAYYTEEDAMDFAHSQIDNVLIITPKGENLDAKEAPDFKEKVLRLIDETHVQHVIFDMHQLQFIDSSGLGCFLSVLRKLNASKGDLKLCSMTKPVRSMFELVSMHKIFEIFPTPQDALKSVSTSKV
jgi:anti-anti-sigma factor